MIPLRGLASRSHLNLAIFSTSYVWEFQWKAIQLRWNTSQKLITVYYEEL